MDDPHPAERLRLAERAGRRLGVGKSAQTAPALVEQITRSILILRGQRVLLDVELANLYGVTTKVLLQAVRRNRDRFPGDFMIQLTRTEWAVLRSQTVTSSAQHGGRRYLPYAFTEQGVAMLSSVLKSHRAIAVNVQIMRARPIGFTANLGEAE